MKQHKRQHPHTNIMCYTRSYCREIIDSLNHYVYTYVVYLH